MNSTKSSRRHELRVHGLPPWLDSRRLLGEASWQITATPGEEARGRLSAAATLSVEDAADLAARLRGVGLDGVPLSVEIEPPLSRTQVRAGRTRDARARRDTTPGFTRREARTDEDGRMYLTPEALALKVGRWAEGRAVVDAGCGVGGNAIGFARAGSEVLAIERDAERARLAAHNARVYGVRVRVEQADALERVRALVESGDTQDTILFCDPPWGAEWDRAGCRLADFPLLEALLELRSAFFELWAKLPPSFDTSTWPEARAQALFGEAPGDRHRVKFVLLRA